MGGPWGVDEGGTVGASRDREPYGLLSRDGAEEVFGAGSEVGGDFDELVGAGGGEGFPSRPCGEIGGVLEPIYLS